MYKMKLFVFSLQVSLLAVALGKSNHYDYTQPQDYGPQQVSYLPQEQQYSIAPQYSTVNNYQQQQLGGAPVEDIYKKEFFVFSAPDEDFEDRYAAQKISTTLQKNLRVIFIRSPEQKGLERAALQLAKHVSDDKTAIYVLNKQADIGDLANRLSAHREQYSRKPEVHFVKYRTAEDAALAQQQIQSHYDALRGTTHSSNEGAAPVLDFVTKQQQLQQQEQQQQLLQPSYGSAISVVPAYSGVSNAGSNSNGYLGQQVASNVDLTDIGSGANSFSTSSLKTFGYNAHSVSSTNSDSFDGYGPIDYNTNAADNAGISAGLNVYGDPRAAKSLLELSAEKRVSKLNERPRIGGKLKFPSDGARRNTYLPHFKRRQ